MINDSWRLCFYSIRFYKKYKIYRMESKIGKKDEQIQALIKSNYNSKKKSLFLWQCQNLWLEVLLSEDWSSLKSLNLSYCKIGDPRIKHINHKILPNLTELYISKNQITAKGINQLLITQKLKPTVLNVSQNFIGDEGADLVIRVVGAGLEYLGLEKIGLSEIGLQSMPILSATNLTQLYLSNNKIGSSGIKLLIKAELPILKTLQLSHCSIGNSGAKNLTKGDWKNLTLLDIRYTGYSHLKDNVWDLLTMISIGQPVNDQYGWFCKFEEVLPLILTKFKQVHLDCLFQNFHLSKTIKAILSERWFAS